MNRLRYLLVVAAMIIVSAACASTDPTTSSDSSSQPPPISTGSLDTTRYEELRVSWTPAEALSASNEERISFALDLHQVQMLFPSEAPVPGPTSAVFILFVSAPTKDIQLDLHVRADDETSPLVSVQSTPGSPKSDLGGQPTIVRGIEGKAKIVPGSVSFLQWQEGGQTYLVQFTSLSLEAIAQWLGLWQMLP